MLVGHVAVGFAGKRIAPQLSLGTLVLAAVLADLLWCIFLIAGIEHVAIVRRGATLMDSTVISQIGWSHGLAADVSWAALLAVSCFAISRNWKGAALIAGVVVSHWLLDFASHHPDMPLAPGMRSVFGLGLWNSVPATLVIEGGFWALSIALYLHATKARCRASHYVFWAGAILWTLAWYNNIAGPPPASDMRVAGIGSFIFFVVIVLWSYWIDRLRPLRALTERSGA